MDSMTISAFIPREQILNAVSPETELYADDAGITWVYYNGAKIIELGKRKSLEDIWVHPEPSYNVGRCKMIKNTGDRCRNPVRPGWTVCRYHGAGYKDKPGGPPAVVGSKFAKHLPTRYMARAQEFFENPDYLSMRAELSLLDARMSELMEQMDEANSSAGWRQVKAAKAIISRANDVSGTQAQLSDAIARAFSLLEDACNQRAADMAVWAEINLVIEQRRKLAETERRRVEAAKAYMTMDEANAMMAYIIDAVMDNVEDPQARVRISEAMRVFSQ